MMGGTATDRSFEDGDQSMKPTTEHALGGQNSDQDRPRPPLTNSIGTQPTNASSSTTSSSIPSSAPVAQTTGTTTQLIFSPVNASLAGIRNAPLTGLPVPDPTGQDELNCTVWIPEIELSKPDKAIFAGIELLEIPGAAIFALSRQYNSQTTAKPGAIVAFMTREAAQNVIEKVKDCGIWIVGDKLKAAHWDTTHYPPPPQTTDTRIIELSGPQYIFGLKDVQDTLRSVLHFDPVETTEARSGGRKTIQLHYSSIPHGRAVLRCLRRLIVFHNLQLVFNVQYGLDPCSFGRTMAARNM